MDPNTMQMLLNIPWYYWVSFFGITTGLFLYFLKPIMPQVRTDT